MLILRILIIIGTFAFALIALTFLGLTMYVITKVWPQARKEDYLLSHGYFCEKGYWCKGDRSLAGDLVYNMSFWRLVDYVERAEEKDGEKAL